MSLPRIGDQVGPYEVVSRLGSGGFAVVFQARDTLLRMDVALKFLRSDIAEDQTEVERFLNEGRQIARLADHPHIVKVFTAGQYDGEVYLALKFVEGTNLEDRLAASASGAASALSFAEIDRIVTAVASALDYAHQHDILHRDVKPSNVLIARTGEVYLSDFGIAKRLQTSSSLYKPTTGLIGTPEFMAPEQFREDEPTSRTDIYALGILVYCVFAGREPFNGKFIDVAFAHLNETPPSVGSWGRTVPDGVDEILQRALQKDPAERYATAGALAVDLHRVLRGAILRDEAVASIEAGRYGEAVQSLQELRQTSVPPSDLDQLLYQGLVGQAEALLSSGDALGSAELYGEALKLRPDDSVAQYGRERAMGQYWARLELPRAGDSLGSYRIEATLGSGAFGVVYRATDTQLGRPAALKVLRPEVRAFEKEVERFKDEGRRLAALADHPHIVNVLGLREDGGHLYLALDFVDGMTLEERLAQAERRAAAPLSLVDIDRIVQAVASALDYAHQNGILHRDVKPQNILLDRDGGVFLSDFGIAKIFDPLGSLRRGSNTLAGTPEYMAPEQFRPDQGVGLRADVYALGLVIYRVFAGRPPFRHSNVLELFRLHRDEPPAPLSAWGRTVPIGVEPVVQRALAKDPSARQGSAAELARELSEALRLTVRREQAEAALVERQFDRAIDLLRAVERTAPGLPEIRALLVRAQIGRGAEALDQGDLELAETSYQEVLRLVPAHPTAVDGLQLTAEAYRRRAEGAETDDIRISALEAVRRLDPSDDGARQQLHEALRRKAARLEREGASDDAGALLAETLMLNPHDAETATRLVDLATRGVWSRQTRSGDAGAWREAVVAQARAALEAEDLDRAEQFAGVVLSSDPMHADARAVRDGASLRRSRLAALQQARKRLDSGDWQGALDLAGKAPLAEWPDVRVSELGHAAQSAGQEATRVTSGAADDEATARVVPGETIQRTTGSFPRRSRLHRPQALAMGAVLIAVVVGTVALAASQIGPMSPAAGSSPGGATVDATVARNLASAAGDGLPVGSSAAPPVVERPAPTQGLRSTATPLVPTATPVPPALADWTALQGRLDGGLWAQDLERAAVEIEAYVKKYESENPSQLAQAQEKLFAASIELGKRAVAAGDFRQARDRYARALALRPGDPLAQGELKKVGLWLDGDAAYGRQEWDAASAAFAELASIDGDFGHAGEKLAAVQVELSKTWTPTPVPVRAPTAAPKPAATQPPISPQGGAAATPTPPPPPPPTRPPPGLTPTKGVFATPTPVH